MGHYKGGTRCGRGAHLCRKIPRPWQVPCQRSCLRNGGFGMGDRRAITSALRMQVAGLSTVDIKTPGNHLLVACARASASVWSWADCHCWKVAPPGDNVSVTATTAMPCFFAAATCDETSGVEF